MENKGLKALIEERIEDESRAVTILHDSIGKVEDMVIRLLLDQLALDSVKHEKMLGVILRLLEHPSKENFEGEELRGILERHVEIEREMLEALERTVDETEDVRIRFLLQDMISDERRHHALMKRAHELVCESNGVRDERWWDFLFRYSRLAG